MQWAVLQTARHNGSWDGGTQLGSTPEQVRPGDGELGDARSQLQPTVLSFPRLGTTNQTTLSLSLSLSIFFTVIGKVI